MQVSKFSDYSFRALIYLGNKRDTQCTVDELAAELNTSTHHMKKVVHKLANLGYIQSQKGRNGGLRLGMEPKDINLGTVLQSTRKTWASWTASLSRTVPSSMVAPSRELPTEPSLRLFRNSPITPCRTCCNRSTTHCTSHHNSPAASRLQLLL